MHEDETYCPRWAFQNADLAVSCFKNIVDGTHKLELDIVGFVGVVEIDWFVGCGWIVCHYD